MGYVYGAFLDTCSQVVTNAVQRLEGNESLSKKLMYGELFVRERMLPNGRSTELRNVKGGCCNHISYTTSYFSWTEQGDTLIFNITDIYNSTYENGEPMESRNNVYSCTITGI